MMEKRKYYFLIKVGYAVVKISSDSMGLLEPLKRRFRNFSTTQHPSIYLSVDLFTDPRYQLQVMPSCARIKFSQKKYFSYYFTNSGSKEYSYCYFVDVPKKRVLVFCKKINYVDILTVVEKAFNFILPYENGVMIHGAAIEYKSKGYVFFGPSGSGKTTIASSLRAGRIFNDDTSLIKIFKSSAILYRVPFRREHILNLNNTRTKVKLKAMFLIVKSKINRVVKMDHKTAIKELLKNNSMPINYKNGHFQKSSYHMKLYNNAKKLYTNVLISKLYFRKKGDFWDMLRKG